MEKDISSERDAPSLDVRSSIEAVERVVSLLGVSGGCAVEVIRKEVNVTGFGVLQRKSLVLVRVKVSNKPLKLTITGTGGSGYPFNLPPIILSF